MKRHKARLRIGAALTATALIAMACGSEDGATDDPDEAAADPDEGETDDASDEPAPADVDNIDRDATLVFPTDIFYDNLDPETYGL